MEERVVHVFSANDLMKKDLFGASDPYVKIYSRYVKPNEDNYIKDLAKTRVIKNTLDPVWGESFIVSLDSYVNLNFSSSDLGPRVLSYRLEALVLEVWDENRLIRDDFLGKVELTPEDLSTLDEPMNLPLEKRSENSRVSGTITVAVRHTDSHISTVTQSELGEDEEDTNESTAAAGASGPSGSRGGLPVGWEERRDNNGRVYYIDHNTRTSQLVRPGLARQASNPPIQDVRNTYMDRRTISMEDTQHEDNDDTTFGDLDDRPLEESESATTTPEDDTVQSAFGGLLVTDQDTQENSPTTPPASAPHASTEEYEEEMENTLDMSDETDMNPHAHTTSEPIPPTPPRRRSRYSPSAPVAQAHSAENNGVPLSTSPATPSSPSFLSSFQSAMRDPSDPLPTPPVPDHQAPWPPQPSAPPQVPHGRPMAQPAPNPQRVPIGNNWDMCRAADGRIFYINHNTRTTTWVDPRSVLANFGPQDAIPHQASSPPSELQRQDSDDPGPLPDGWEEKVLPNGKIYFIDHLSKKTKIGRAHV